MIRDFETLTREVISLHKGEEFDSKTFLLLLIYGYCLYLKYTIVHSIKSMAMFPLFYGIGILFDLRPYHSRFICGF